MGLEIINEQETISNPKRPSGGPTPKFVPGEKWRNNDRYFIIDVVIWSSLGYIKSIGLIELATRKLQTVTYENFKRWTENGTMEEWRV